MLLKITYGNRDSRLKYVTHGFLEFKKIFSTNVRLHSSWLGVLSQAESWPNDSCIHETRRSSHVEQLSVELCAAEGLQLGHLAEAGADVWRVRAHFS